MEEESATTVTAALDHENSKSGHTEDNEWPEIVQDGETAPTLAWNALVGFLAEVEPVPAAGIGGIVIIIVLAIFGSIGALVVGFIGGALLHASIERRREHTDWTFKFKADDHPLDYVTREVEALNMMAIDN
jgi:hypothetical protein